ncbi:AAA family ATPase [Roseivirga sp. BDSF3-8]|uniref:AAA family ATPase n=1 Tax=Roseivirga sp. BDSF3-8 TaxID=3241598 RepID=UPI0035326168
MENEIFDSRLDLSGLSEAVSRIRLEVGKVIVGQDQMVDLLLTALLADGHVLIEGVPGVAKTLTSKVLARILNVDFSRIQFTPDLMPSDILGTSVFNMKEGTFSYRKGPVFTNILLIDEINRSPAKTQAALFEVMEERQVTADGETLPFQEPFMVVATQNPIEQEGTYRLPEAQLDRFLFKIEVGYPDVDDEVSILKKFHTDTTGVKLDTLSKVLSGEEIVKYRQITREIHVSDEVFKYIASLVSDTRGHHDLYLGASPRASLAILAGAKAYAAISGRDFVTPEDVQFIAAPVLRHRLILTPEKEMEGDSVDKIIGRIIDKLEVPR